MEDRDLEKPINRLQFRYTITVTKIAYWGIIIGIIVGIFANAFIYSFYQLFPNIPPILSLALSGASLVFLWIYCKNKMVDVDEKLKELDKLMNRKPPL